VAAQEGTAASSAASSRGVDLWLYGPSSAPAGGRLDLSVVALGFPTATTLTPLAGASVEAAWDPTSLTGDDEPKPAVAPPPVVATTDVGGSALLAIPVPPGRALAMRLIVRVKVGDKERTKELTVQRRRPDSAELFVSDTAVVPGTEVTAWALFDGERARPPGGEVEVLLTQGDVVRHRVKTKTDGSGTAWAKVPIPKSAAAESRYALEVRRLEVGGEVVASASTTLRTREENPGKPSVSVRFSEDSVAAGNEAEDRIRIRDGSGEALRNHPVRVWSGPRGTAAPATEEAFDEVATKLVSNDDGEVITRVKAPSTVPRSGTELSLELRTEIEGQTVVRRASIEVGERRGTVTITPEGGELLCGRSQRVVFQLTRDRGEPLVGTFSVKADGLDTRFTTNAHGEAEVAWTVPRDAGAFRDVGPCPGNVAVGLTVRAVEPSDAARAAFGGALVGPDGLATCVPVRREEGVLLRPSFRASDEEYVPFISFRRGFSLRSPGPDGKLGSRDDVTSPFERVLESGTPYADASFEDEVVDARWDMAVAEATVASWQSALKRATGTELGGGRGEGIGLGGIGSGGGGTGYGYGHGRLGGASRVTGDGFASMTPPIPTDERGRARIAIKLGDEETTWQIALVGLPRDAKPAVSSVDVPVTVPLSSKVFAGARMTEGDRTNVVVRVRNRTDAPLAASLRFAASGALELGGAETRNVQVPARGATTVEVPVAASAGKTGALSVTTSAPGVETDVVRHDVEVEPAGRLMNVARTAWVSA
jgi:hypothetical protein